MQCMEFPPTLNASLNKQSTEFAVLGMIALFPTAYNTSLYPGLVGSYLPLILERHGQ